MNQVVLAGVGHEYRQDDGAGPAVAGMVANRAPGVTQVGPVETPLDLLGRWDGATLAVIIDAVRSGARPGTVHVIELDPQQRRQGGTPSGSTHGLGVDQVWRLAQATGVAPLRVVLVGIEGEAFGYGSELSANVAAAVPVAVQQVLEIVEEHRSCA